MTHLPSIRLQMYSSPAGASTWKSRSGPRVIETMRADPVLQRIYLGAKPRYFTVGIFSEVSKTALNRFW